ncbi:MAG: NYN domain-containing protein, partial [Nitrospinales bacterium]
MHYLVDGYNLMFRVLHAGDDLQAQREEIILDLNEKIQVLHLDVLIVFDAQYQYGRGSRSHLNYLEICFTDKGETADDFIIHKLKSTENPKQITVVTSDNKLGWRARRCLAKTETVEIFLTWLNKRYQNRIRQREKRQKATKTRSPRGKKPSRKLPIKRGPPPSPGKSAEESFDYYLYQ